MFTYLLGIPLLWYCLGTLSGAHIGFLVAIRLIKYNPGPPMRIMEEHGVSRYE